MGLVVWGTGGGILLFFCFLDHITSLSSFVARLTLYLHWKGLAQPQPVSNNPCSYGMSMPCAQHPLRIRVCCVKPLSVWSVVRVGLGDSYSAASTPTPTCSIYLFPQKYSWHILLGFPFSFDLLPESSQGLIRMLL